jgi:penicillin-binding protein 1A
LLGGVWIGCDDQFIRLENNLGYGGEAARPIWEYFFKKVLADKSLGVDKDAKFSIPAEMQNEINSADIMEMIDTLPPGAQGEDEGVGHSNDFIDMPNKEYIPAESQPVIDENKKAKKDTTAGTPKIGDMDKNDKQKKKKGFFQKLFGKKDK